MLLRFQMNCEGSEGKFRESRVNRLALPTQKNALRYQNKRMPSPNMTSLLIWSQPIAKVFSRLFGVTMCACTHVCVHNCIVSGSGRQQPRRDVTYSWCRFTERSWQTQERLPGTAIPSHPPYPFPKRTVMLCHYGNKWLLVLKCIDNCGKITTDL